VSNLYVPGRVSIIMPLYNAKRFVEYALRSIVEQDYDNLELIVINDGSTDDTMTIVNDTLAGSKLLWKTYYSSGPSAYTPMTMAYTLLAGIVRCTGEYFTIHCYDNISLPGRFTKLVGVIGDNAAAYSPFMRIKGDDNTHPYEEQSEMGYGGDCNENLTIYAKTRGRERLMRIITDTVIMRKDYYMKRRAYIPLLRDGGYDDEIGWILAMFSMGDIVKVPEPLLLFRVGTGDNVVNDGDRLVHLMRWEGYDMKEVLGGNYLYAKDRLDYYFTHILRRRL
jgi:glycosyltransferase involved in cell wall biosynthesis